MTLWQMSLSGGLLILAGALVRKFTLDRLPKKTFLILWEIAVLRLLLPFSIPSLFSAWSLISRRESGGRIYTKLPAEGFPPVTFYGPSPAAGTLSETAAASLSRPVSLWVLLWGIGASALALFFVVSWFRCRREFAASLPVSEDYTDAWLREHPLPFGRTIRIRQSDRIRTPLTFGIFRPVILFPKETDWTDSDALSWILLHESVHIRRFDALVKLLAAFTLCIHWFNPAVYLLYFLLNQDLELACDESVVQASGKDGRSAYALTLIRLEEAKGRLFSPGNSFSGNAMKERITSIMKTRKKSLFTVLAAAALIVCMTAVFATSVAAEDERQKPSFIPDTAFSEDEYQQLLALCPDGYEQMSVMEYQQKVWELTDTSQYLDLLERFSQDMQIYALKDENEIASFLHYTLNPLTSERWQEHDFGGSAVSDFPFPADNALLEYVVTLSILDRQNVTVGQYNDARAGMLDGLQDILEDQTKEELQDEALLNEHIRQTINQLVSRWSTDSLQITVDYTCMPLSASFDPEKTKQSSANASDTSRHPSGVPAAESGEQREYPNATEEDYRSLLTLKTPDYPDISVRDFNAALLERGNTDDAGSLDRILCDIQWNDCQAALTAEEQMFVQTSVFFSFMENARYVQSQYNGRLEEDPEAAENLPVKQVAENGTAAFCDLYYQFSWHIADKDRLTVRERDQAVNGLRTAVRDFWTDTDLEELLTMTKEDLTALLSRLAREYSTDQITLSVKEDHISFETMDERGRDFQ